MAKFANIATQIRDRVYSELSTKPKLRMLTPGLLPAWDDCCSGQLTVRMVNILPTYSKGTCPSIIRVTFGISLIRCVHTMNDDGSAPLPKYVNSDGEMTMDDAHEVYCALSAWKPNGVYQWKLLQWTPEGAEGGCAGGEWQVEAVIV